MSLKSDLKAEKLATAPRTLPKYSNLFDAEAQRQLYVRIVAACGPEATEVRAELPLRGRSIAFTVTWTDGSMVRRKVEHVMSELDLGNSSENDVVNAMCDLLIGMVEQKVREIEGRSNS